MLFVWIVFIVSGLDVLFILSQTVASPHVKHELEAFIAFIAFALTLIIILISKGVIRI